MKEELKYKISKIIQNHDFVSYNYLSEKLNISISSSKRYIKELADSLNLHIVRGGVKNGNLGELDNFRKKSLNIQLKKDIAIKAIKHIKEHDVVFLDAGTTTIELAKIIPENMNITIFSNNLDIVEVLANKNIPTYIIGGKINYKTSAVSGSVAQDMINKISFSIAFLGCNGYDEKNFYTTNISEATFKRFVASRASRFFFLGDKSKKNVKYSYKIRSMDKKQIIS